ncbi:MAG: class I SAM-dependent methyltransferase, partial [Candidatus Bathyarchaeota archaeon]|nr:class I SAM-dependent methyltransferase [Candidatus Bathyarchaeota archaeon]
GPGDNESTQQAYSKLADLPNKPRILDVGCGPGMQTIQLAKISNGQIEAVDNHQPFLDQLIKNAEQEELSNRINVAKGDMLNLEYESGSFDLIWSEGSIFIIGFEKGLREWKRLLTEDGYLVASELTWIKTEVPQEAKTYMNQEYPAIKTIKENLQIALDCGYRVVGFFVLPTQSWWDNYYNPIQEKLPALKAKHKDDKEALQGIDMTETEIEMFRKFSDYYGYVFYLLQAS